MLFNMDKCKLVYFVIRIKEMHIVEFECHQVRIKKERFGGGVIVH